MTQKASSVYRFFEDKERGFVIEPEKRVTIALEADVVVAGGGISGIIAAIAAGRKGVKTVLMDRMGSLGGNMGPGYFIGGSLSEGANSVVPGGLSGIPGEFVRKVNKLSTQTTSNYADTSEHRIVSCRYNGTSVWSGVDLVRVRVGSYRRGRHRQRFVR